MQLSSRQHFEADPHAVHAMVTDPDFLAETARAAGARDARVTASPHRTAVETSVETPSEVRAFVGPTLQLTQEAWWGAPGADGARRGTFTMRFAGLPVELGGTTTLAPAASGTVLDYAGELVVRLPLVGPMVERSAAPVILAALEVQERVGREWLRRG